MFISGSFGKRGSRPLNPRPVRKSDHIPACAGIMGSSKGAASSSRPESYTRSLAAHFSPLSMSRENFQMPAHTYVLGALRCPRRMVLAALRQRRLVRPLPQSSRTWGFRGGSPTFRKGFFEAEDRAHARASSIRTRNNGAHLHASALPGSLSSSHPSFLPYIATSWQKQTSSDESYDATRPSLRRVVAICCRFHRDICHRARQPWQ